MVNDNCEVKAYIVLYNLQSAFPHIIPCEPPNGPVAKLASRVVISWRNLSLREIKQPVQTQDSSVPKTSQSLFLYILLCHLAGKTHGSVPSHFHLNGCVEQSIGSVPSSDFLPSVGLFAEGSVFWEGLALATNTLRDCGYGTPWAGEVRLILGVTRGFGCSPFGLSSWGSSLILKERMKVET